MEMMGLQKGVSRATMPSFLFLQHLDSRVWTKGATSKRNGDFFSQKHQTIAENPPVMPVAKAGLALWDVAKGLGFR